MGALLLLWEHYYYHGSIIMGAWHPIKVSWLRSGVKRVAWVSHLPTPGHKRGRSAGLTRPSKKDIEETSWLKRRTRSWRSLQGSGKRGQSTGGGRTNHITGGCAAKAPWNSLHPARPPLCLSCPASSNQLTAVVSSSEARHPSWTSSN